MGLRFVFAVSLGCVWVIGTLFLWRQYSSGMYEFLNFFPQDKSLQVIFEDAVLSSGRLRRSLMDWGKSFGGVQSNNIFKNCSFNHFPVCCSVFSYSDESVRPIKAHRQLHESINERSRCDLYREYISSPYEDRQVDKAAQLNQIIDVAERKRDLIAFISSTEEKDSADIWIRRAAVHMSSDEIRHDAKNDQEYLSYFLFTKECSQPDGSIEAQTWCGKFHILIVMGRCL